MATVDVYNLKREKVGTVDLADEVFAAEVKEHLFYEVVKAQLACKRQGTATAKNRSAVSGSTKKLYKQKGTGNARHGSIRAPVHVGGGQAHPPRNARLELPPAAPGAPRRAPLGALEVPEGRPPRRGRPLRARRDQDEGLAPGARRAQGGATRRSSSTSPRNENLRLSIRNCADHQFLPPEGVNVYDLLRHDTLVLSKDAAKALEARCLVEGERSARAAKARCEMTPSKSSVGRSS